jgi:hypothetical protein
MTNDEKARRSLETECTPGPWKFEALGRRIVAGRGMIGEFVGDETGQCEDAANGRLAAAAPELVAIAKGLAEWYKHGHCGPYRDTLFEGDEGGRTWNEVILVALMKAGFLA